jgi:hypothetical protein
MVATREILRQGASFIKMIAGSIEAPDSATQWVETID